MKIINKYRNATEKDKAVFRNVIGAFIVRGGGLVVSLFTLPVYLRFFENQQILGVWFTVLSILSWILNFDLGVGNGLRNNLTRTLTLKEDKESKEYISSAYWVLGLIVLLFFILGMIVMEYIEWNSVFNVSSSIIPKNVMLEVVRFVFFSIMLQFFLRLISSVLYAMQKSALNNFISLLSKVLELLVIIILPSLSPVHNIRTLSIVHIFTANLPLLIATFVIFFGPLKSCRPQLSFYKKEKAKDVLSLGGIFFICQVLYMLIANTNEFFISLYTEPENVVEYQVYFKLFTLSSMMFMLALAPIWSAVSKAIAEKDFVWLRKLHRNLTKFAYLGILAEFLLIPFLQFMVNLWLKEKAIQINYFYAFSFALFGSAMIFQSAVSTITNGTGRMKIQAISYAIGVVFKFLIIHFGIRLVGNWIVVVLANAIILVPYCIIQQLDLSKYLSRQITIQEN